MTGFDPNDHREQCEAYLERSLGTKVRLLGAEPLDASTRQAPWRLDVRLGGEVRSYVLRLDTRGAEHEYDVLRAMEAVPIPTPRAYGWDPAGDNLGVPSYFYEFIVGESLLRSLLAGEPWAEELYVDTVLSLQAVTRGELAQVAGRFGAGETAAQVLDLAHAYFVDHPDPVAEAAYVRLRREMPPMPVVRFSNGDLWPDNLIVRERELVGVIDFEHAGFSDPLFEFLLAFFVAPELCGRGTEELYCRRMGIDPGVLPWYRVLEIYDTWHWVAKTGKPFVHHTAQSLQADLERWLNAREEAET